MEDRTVIVYRPKRDKGFPPRLYTGSHSQCEGYIVLLFCAECQVLLSKIGYGGDSCCKIQATRKRLIGWLIG